MAFLTQEQLEKAGFKHLGREVKISDRASFYNTSNITIGDYSRIDDFCILSAGSGGISIGAHVHVACYSSLIGKGKIILEDFSNISSRVAIYSSTDDFSGEFMTNPTVPEEFTNVFSGDVTIRKHVIIGAGSVILPNVVLGEGVAIGSLSLVTKSCEDFFIYGGVPAKKLKARSRRLLTLEQAFKPNPS